MFISLTKHFLIVSISCILFESCLSLSVMQTARTTAKNEFAGGGALGISVLDEYPMLDMEAAVRYGCTDNLDVGLTLNFFGMVSADVKRQFVGDHSSLIAVSSGAGYAFGQWNNSDSEKIVYHNIILPLYASYHPFRLLSVYCSPKYIYLYERNHNKPTPSHVMHSHICGATTGIKIGDRYSFMAELTLARDFKRNKDYYQNMFGFAYGIQ